MAISICKAEIGSWYRDIENCLFEVIALDDSEGAIEVQYADGDVTEYDQESWDLLCVNLISEPGVGIGDYGEVVDENILPEQMKPISWDNVISDVDNQEN